MTQITAVCDLGHSRKAKPNGICIHLAITCNEIAAAEIQNQQEIEMQKRQLGNSDLQITPVGYGAWAIGGSGWQFAWGSQDDNDSIDAIHRALELGVNWIDTAAVYGLGHSEEVVARALKSWSGPRPYVFTKCGLRWDDDGNVRKVLTADSIRHEVEDQVLTHCRRENIGVIVYSPMASGLLTGAMTRERAAKLSKDDWRRTHPDFIEPNLSRNLALVERLHQIARRHSRSAGEVAIAWTLHNAAVTGAIVGARNAHQAEGVMRAGELRLTDEDVSGIETLVAETAA